MDMDLQGKVAIVTGGARGIGRAYSKALAQAGAAVLIADMLEKDGIATQEAIRATGGQALFRTVDIADPAQTQAMAQAAADTFGGVDILVNNAAMFSSLRGGPLEAISFERWQRTMAVNITGVWLCIRAVVPHMRARNGGAIVNKTSIAAFGSPGMLDYAVSKTAVIGITKSAAMELGRDNIRVNAIAPGGVTTQARAEILGDHLDQADAHARASQAIGRSIAPDDMVGTLLYLVGPGAAFVTGQTIVVDGGRHFLG